MGSGDARIVYYLMLHLSTRLAITLRLVVALAWYKPEVAPGQQAQARGMSQLAQSAQGG